MKKKKKLIQRRSFIKKAGLLTLGGVAGAVAIKAPYGYTATNPIKWRLQTYSGAPLGKHVVLPQVEAFNKAILSRLKIMSLLIYVQIKLIFIQLKIVDNIYIAFSIYFIILPKNVLEAR